ncbi:MAG: hypothetical protein RLZZ511_1998 [Cyanobacteriota bacterium]|jgi:uncharacterized protein (TIGR04255 family)
MTERRHYSKAPIREAIIDFRVVLPDYITLKNLYDLFPKINADYPQQESSWLLQSQVTAGPSIGTSTNQTQTGYVYTSSDRRQVLNAGLAGFTFSQMEPYDRWEVFRDEAKRLWQIYRESIDILSVTRIGARYVNRIDIPSTSIDFKDFFRTIPEVSPDLPQGLSGYFMQLQIPQEDIEAMVLINQFMAPPQSSESVSVILDIDVFQEALQIVDDSFWASLEILHAKIDNVFEACITNKTRELIQ